VAQNGLISTSYAQLDFWNRLYSLDYQTIQQYQQNDPRLQAAHEQLPNKFPRIQVANGVELIVYQKEQNIPWRIAVPDAMVDRLITWYHQTLIHTGI
jgi:hypothetical protein